MRESLRSLRLAVRSLRKRPWSSAAAVAILGVGVGATTAIFSLANWALFRPIPGVEHADRLVLIEVGPEGREAVSGFSHPTARRLLESPSPLVSGAAFAPLTVDIVVGPDGPARRATALVVTPGYFETLGVRAIRGRSFLPDEGDEGAVHAVAVLSDEFWRTALQGDPAILGRTLDLNRRRFTVVGVAPPGFAGHRRGNPVDLWVPSSAYPAALPRLPRNVLAMEGAPIWLGIIARLDERSAAGRLAAPLTRAVPELASAGLEVRVDPEIGLSRAARDRFRDTLGTLAGLVALLLLLTTASLANLVLSRVARRRTEVAVRRALGAPARRIAADLLAEGVIIAVLGTAVAVLAGFGFLELSGGARVLSWLPDSGTIPVDWRVSGFALAASLVAVTGATIVGVRRAVGSGPLEALRGARGIAGGRGASRRVLLAAQLALSLALIIGAGLMLRSMGRFRATELGFDPDGVLVFSLNPGVQGYGDEDADRLFRALIADLRDAPGIGATGFSWLAPLGPQRYSESVRSIGAGGGEPIVAQANMVDPGALGTLGIRLIDGRMFDDREYGRFERPDRGTVLINRTLADLLFPDGSAVGSLLVIDGREESAFEVIGVVEDARLASVREPDGPRLYDPFGNGYRTNSATFVVRADGDPDAALVDIGRLVRQHDPRLPLIEPGLLRDRVLAGVTEERTITRLTTAFALVSLVLAAVGLYGMASEAAQARRREFGIRATFGARGPQVAAIVVRDAMITVAAGTAVGLLVGLWTTRLLQSRLIGIAPVDPVVFGLAPVVLAAITLASVLGPAIRSARLDPVEVLRAE